MRTDTASDDVRRAILLMLGFAVFIPLVEGAAKALGEGGMAAAQIAWVRFTVQVVLVGVILATNGGIGWPRPVWAFILRGVFITAGSGFLYAGLAFLPIADNTAILFIEPLMITALSALVLKEQVGIWRWGAVVAGFAGAVTIVGPNFHSVGWASVLPTVAALSYASGVIITRQYRAHGSALEFQYTTAVTACVILTLALTIGAVTETEALTPSWPTSGEFQLLAVVGGVAAATNFMLTQAFRSAPSSVIAPFLYVTIIGSTIMGFLAFGDVPRPEMILGTIVIIGSGLTVWWRESH